MWMLWWCACKTDLLGGMGLEPAAPPAPVADAPVATPDAAPPPAEAPEAPAAAPAPVAEAPPPPSPASYNPISVPEGPRTEGGVKWAGVKSKYERDEEEIIPPQE